MVLRPLSFNYSCWQYLFCFLIVLEKIHVIKVSVNVKNLIRFISRYAFTGLEQKGANNFNGTCNYSRPFDVFRSVFLSSSSVSKQHGLSLTPYSKMMLFFCSTV